MHTIKELQDICHSNSYNSGWWTHQATSTDLSKLIRGEDKTSAGEFNALLAGALVSQKICLSHSELSEAMEGHRKGLMDDKLPHRPMIEVEMADTVIRILDLCGALELDLEGAIMEKLSFNKSRPDHKLENRMAEGGKSY